MFLIQVQILTFQNLNPSHCIINMLTDCSLQAGTCYYNFSWADFWSRRGLSSAVVIPLPPRLTGWLWTQAEFSSGRQLYWICIIMTHGVIDRGGEDPEQAGDAASDAGEHSVTLHQGSVLQLPRRICARSQESIVHRGQNEASTLTEERRVRIKVVWILKFDELQAETRGHEKLIPHQLLGEWL